MKPEHQPFFQRFFDTQSLDGYLCTDLPELRFLTAFSGTDGLALILGDQLWFLCDSRYVQQAHAQVTADHIRQYTTKVSGLNEVLGSGKKRIGFHAAKVSVAMHQKLNNECGHIDWVAIDDGLDPLRMIKSPEDIQLLRQTAALHADGFSVIEPLLKPGSVERDIALELEFALKKLGGEEKAFDYIVASGLRGAMPHGVASDKVIESGELVTIDFGTRLQGFHSDETVTVGIGEVPQQLRTIHDIVLEAHDRAMAAVCPGISMRELDGIAREYIQEKGYGDHFGHGLGHGVGLEIHEAPVVSQRSEVIATENMVFTIEPGIYVEGLGGVRIEDTVAVTRDGCIPLTVLPKHYRIY